MISFETPVLYQSEEVSEVAHALVKVLQTVRMITFKGTLGAGKTTLIRTLLRNLGVNEVITSPTFTYVNVYRLEDGRVVYHFDLYRISAVEEFIAGGFLEYLDDKNALVFIEWPEVIEPLLAHYPHKEVSLEHDSSGGRLITVRDGALEMLESSVR